MFEQQNVSLDLPIDAWVEEVRDDPIAHRDRRVTHILLAAIGFTPDLQKTMILKGGTLMMLAFGSPRGTQRRGFHRYRNPSNRLRQSWPRNLIPRCNGQPLNLATLILYAAFKNSSGFHD